MNYSGIIYRLWAVSGTLCILGVVAIVIGLFAPKENKKELFLAGALVILVGLVAGIHYTSSLLSPEIESMQGVFDHSYRNSRVAPPLPFTMEYTFYDEERKGRIFYLDVFSEAEIIPDGFVVNQEYMIYYERDTKIVLKVESLP